MNPSDSLAWTEMAPAAVADLTVGEEALDKPALTVSPDGRLTVVYQRGRRIMLRRSPDGGRHWLPERLVSDSATARAHGPSVTSAGDRYVVCWYEQEAPGSAEELWCNRSNDGHRFGRPERLFRSERALPPPTGYRIAVGRFAPGANAWVAADPSTGRIYLAFAAGTAQASDILLWRLDRADTSWRGPDRVGHGPPAASKVFPTVAVAEGIPHVMYYDQRRDPGTGWTDVYLSSRTGDGHHDIRLNDEPTDWTLMPPDAEHAPIQRNAGDYITLAADGPRLLAVWTDGRLGQPRIFARTVEVIR
jgi:hypothetical protein